MQLLDDVAARETIRELINRYCIEADRGCLDRVCELFAPEAVYGLNGRWYSGPEGATQGGVGDILK